MPRINIDDRLFSDHRFCLAERLIGNRNHAIGCIYSLFRLAQTYWVPLKKPIPLAIFKTLEHHEILKNSGFVKRQIGGWYVCGSEEYFAWLSQKHEASRKSLKSREEKRTVRSTEHVTRSPSDSCSFPGAPAAVSTGGEIKNFSILEIKKSSIAKAMEQSMKYVKRPSIENNNDEN